MKKSNSCFGTRTRDSERGQVLPLVAVAMIVLLGMAGFAIDAGSGYLSYRELQASTDAAALAGAATLPSSSAAATATAYSGVNGDKNAYSNLPNVTMVSGYPAVQCLSTFSSGFPCTAPANGNAVAVEQQVTVPTHFAKLIGFKSFSMTAASKALMMGGQGNQYNIVIIVDTTKSMDDNDSDPGSTCNGTRISCALAGVQVLLSHLFPCPTSQTSGCGSATNGNVATPWDRVSLLTFPGLTNSNEDPNEYCGQTKSTPQIQIAEYNNSPVYQVVNFSSDYRSSDSSSSLNSSSDDVLASGGGGCSGLQVIGGVGTFYAGVINQAQSLLAAEKAAYPTTTNAMIILSDGDATATSADMGKGTYAASQECHQAVTAAQSAAAAGTRVYTVAYGTESSGTCPTDTNPTITACQTMQQMASNASFFFSDGGSSQNACVSASRSATSLNQIFDDLSTSFTPGRLVPNNTN